MIILREWLGGAEEIDLGEEDGMTAFAHGIVQDWEIAYELTDRMFSGEEEILINGNEAEFIERYTVINERLIPAWRDDDHQPT